MTGPIAFPPIAKHGVIGDRRTAALVSADGTVTWFCAPDYDARVVCGALLDPERGGFFRFGPTIPTWGEQSYRADTVRLSTRWRDDRGELELTDFMPWPDGQRAKKVEAARVIVRRLRALSGSWSAALQLWPRQTFVEDPRVSAREQGATFDFQDLALGLWASVPVSVAEQGAHADFTLAPGDEAWAVFGVGVEGLRWSVERCQQLAAATDDYWRRWSGHLRSCGFADEKLRRVAMTVHLLAHAPNDAVVAAVTTSLPERIGGDRNYDYRYTWVRDASVSAAFLAVMGGTSDVVGYFDWLCQLDSDVEAPLQVCYGTDGRTELAERKLRHVTGYRESQPVRFGNGAYQQRQLGSLGWFADSALIFLESGGEWKPAYWHLLARAAEYVCSAWQREDSGVWELDEEAHYVASKVMAWVTLDRALRIASLCHQAAPGKWTEARAAIRDEVLEKGWSEARQTFLQRYDSDAVDAAALLIPLMDFLPATDPRVLATLGTIEKELVLDGLVYRFDPQATLGKKALPLGEFEGAFLPATFWYAHALVGAGRAEQAQRILQRCEQLAGGPGVFAEEVDPRSGAFLGNTPLLLSQVEYGRALLALAAAQR